jgi:hypothetical protein
VERLAKDEPAAQYEKGVWTMNTNGHPQTEGRRNGAGMNARPTSRVNRLETVLNAPKRAVLGVCWKSETGKDGVTWSFYVVAL